MAQDLGQPVEPSQKSRGVMIDKVTNTVGKENHRAHYDYERNRRFQWGRPFVYAIHQPAVNLRKAVTQAYVSSPLMNLLHDRA